MSSEDDAMPQRRDGVSGLASYFDKTLSGSNETKPTKRLSSQQGTTTHIKEEIICVTFEKQIGRIHDFKFYYGRNSRGTTGLFIRTVSPQSPLAGLITAQDQIIRVNDKDIKNSESDSINHILDNLSGTVRLEVARIKYYEEIGKQVLEEAIVSKNPTLVPTDEQTLVQRNTNRDWRNRQHEEPKSGKNRSVAKGRTKPVSTRPCQEKEVQRKTMATKMPAKNIDDIKDVKKMMELFELLDLAHDPENLNLTQMKKEAKNKIKEQSSGSGQYSNGTTGFSVISKAKKGDMEKRNELDKYYSLVDNCLKQIDGDQISILNTYLRGRDIFELHNEHKDRLGKRDYHILVGGESSSGKSSLLNLILGEELLPHHTLHATSTICELKYGEERKLVVHYKYDIDQIKKPPPETVKLQTVEECKSTYQEQIAPYMRLDQKDRHKGSEYEKVELFWPHELLQKGVVIIDSPGIGESNDMDKVLMNYLPNAFAFIYVIDVSKAGGLQENFREKLKKIVEKLQLLEGGTEQSKSLAECSLFVCNKWDLVPEEEQHNVKTYVEEGLSECWQDKNVHIQIVYMRTLEAIQLQQYGGVTAEFNDLLQNIKQMILRAINVRLYNHWQWLDLVLFQIFKLTDFYTREIQLNAEKTRERMDYIERRVQDIDQQQQNVQDDMVARLKYQSDLFSSKLWEYVNSPEFKQKFCSWTKSPLPPEEDTWETTKNNMKKAIENKFQQCLIQWEGENQIYSKFHRELLDEFLARLNLIKEELEGGDTLQSVERQINYLNNRSQLSTKAKILVGATSPLWIPVGVAGLVISMPVVALMTVKKKITESVKLEEYRTNPRDYLEKRSRKFLVSSPRPKEAVCKFTDEQIKKTVDILSKYIDMIPRVIDADQKMVSHLRKETRSQEEVLQHYNPLRQKSSETRKNMIPLGIQVYPATVDQRDLDWKPDSASCLGEGEFSLVYTGKLKNRGRNRNLQPNRNLDIAVKVFKQPFDGLNSRFYLNEEMMLTSLEHKNVLRFFGAIKISVSNTDNRYKFAFVMKYCPANLRNIIRKNKSVTPAKADNAKQAIDTCIKWLTQIADGLNYIHERGLVHRHLKLENILVDGDDTAMIGDIGIVGIFKETEKSIIYLAPEVLTDPVMCTKAADIYSYGIMMWEMWYGTKAFEELMPLDKATFKEKIVSGYRPKQDDLKISFPGLDSNMKSCWRSDPSQRLSAKECFEKFDEIWKSRNGRL